MDPTRLHPARSTIEHQEKSGDLRSSLPEGSFAWDATQPMEVHHRGKYPSRDRGFEGQTEYTYSIPDYPLTVLRHEGQLALLIAGVTIPIAGDGTFRFHEDTRWSSGRGSEGGQERTIEGTLSAAGGGHRLQLQMHESAGKSGYLVRDYRSDAILRVTDRSELPGLPDWSAVRDHLERCLGRSRGAMQSELTAVVNTGRDLGAEETAEEIVKTARQAGVSKELAAVFRSARGLDKEQEAISIFNSARDVGRLDDALVVMNTALDLGLASDAISVFDSARDLGLDETAVSILSSARDQGLLKQGIAVFNDARDLGLEPQLVEVLRAAGELRASREALLVLDAARDLGLHDRALRIFDEARALDLEREAIDTLARARELGVTPETIGVFNTARDLGVEREMIGVFNDARDLGVEKELLRSSASTLRKVTTPTEPTLREIIGHAVELGVLKDRDLLPPTR